MSARTWAVLAGAVASLWGTQASATFVRSHTTEGCHPVFWSQTCVPITPDSAGVPDLPLSEVERIVQQALSMWQTPTSGSSFLRLQYLPANMARETDALDRLQVIKFRSNKWCRPASASKAEVCYDAAAAAITTVTYVNKPLDATLDGRIVDADIELNAVNNQFYDADKPVTVTGSRRASDLWNTLSHELGHLIGLEHSCRRSGDTMPACTRDGNGQAVISCSLVESMRMTNPSYQAIFDTTMYPTADPKEIKKRVPKADDLAGVVNAYPTANDPKNCNSTGGGGTEPSGCQCNNLGRIGSAQGGPKGVGWGLFGLLGLSGLVGWRRRERRLATMKSVGTGS